MSYGPLILLALQEARNKFSKTTPDNRDQIARWVQRRVEELKDDKAPFDPKAAAANDK